ncbi:hypothetical protein SARC_03464 [Sphaeroforma arctica JP610]|uniref:Uncharacterized protein n=1 Tax=Sphaeroforma arctica JP610 TaxID=667725 RepID=A0A0L0G7T8_9EUKA|nr:hypothetical protein SARC_03464 [Sphaeroforma arctica JP610]KNC84303.1 hypothetical protein SARC_03464 [Sphaeroforma arctica JP610]|eukprot:XP_014158205.1 hypothetical protein SARC_03464 [Sphaeroforma arctica JP610]
MPQPRWGPTLLYRLSAKGAKFQVTKHFWRQCDAFVPGGVAGGAARSVLRTSPRTMAPQPTPVELSLLERKAAQATEPKRKMSDRRVRRASARHDQVQAAVQRVLPKSKGEVESAVKRAIDGPSPYRIRGFVLS